MTDLPETMKAVTVTAEGVVLAWREVPRPQPSELIVHIRAVGMNRADIGISQGHTHGSIGGEGTILGLEYAGEIVARGDDVPDSFKTGDRVMCSGAGGYAEFAACDWRRCYHIPDPEMSYAMAATLPIALQTMHEALTATGGFIAGETVLIHGASSGVGLMGLQIARALGASTVIGTSRNHSRRKRLSEYGAQLALDPGNSDWVSTVHESAPGGVDLIIDMVSGPSINECLAATRVLGRIVNIGRLGGQSANFDFDLHALRRIRYLGATFRTRSLEEIRVICEGVQRDLIPLVAKGELSLPIDRHFALDDAVEALNYVSADNHFGKVILDA